MERVRQFRRKNLTRRALSLTTVSVNCEWFASEEGIRMATEIETLRWQFELTWRLAEYHLPALSDEACLWESATGSWTVRRGADGLWRADWSESEPDPPPTTTIGWLSWHLIWWWSGLIAVARDEARVVRQDVVWPGSAEATVQRLRALSTDWRGELAKLGDADLERPFAYPWNEPRPLRTAIAWANSELMKNVAEIGYARLLFEARQLRGPATS
jgi:hypothetical protein